MSPNSDGTGDLHDNKYIHGLSFLISFKFLSKHDTNKSQWSLRWTLLSVDCCAAVAVKQCYSILREMHELVEVVFVAVAAAAVFVLPLVTVLLTGDYGN